MRDIIKRRKAQREWRKIRPEPQYIHSVPFSLTTPLSSSAESTFSNVKRTEEDLYRREFQNEFNRALLKSSGSEKFLRSKGVIALRRRSKRMSEDWIRKHPEYEWASSYKVRELIPTRKMKKEKFKGPSQLMLG